MKCQKKGLSYVDWVISLGTFLIAVIFIFILIRPQFEPKDEKQSLMQIIENGFYTETEWTVREIPIFITKLQDQYTGPSGIITASIKINHSPDFGYTITQPPASRIKVSKGNPIIIQCVSGICTNEKMTLVFYPLDPKNKGSPGLDLQCHPSNTAICDAVAGASIAVTGINQQELNQFPGTGYANIKTKMSYPSSREFAIFIDDTNILSSPPVPQQANVYVKERKYWKLTKENIRDLITVRFQVW